jgi:molybdopterin molybdotransferase
MPIEQALRKQNELIKAISDVDQVDLADAFKRIIAEDVTAPLNVPGANNSAMDGFALKAEDSAQPLKIVAQVLAGHPFSGQIQNGEAVRIMTGAPVPAGANAVIMQEETRIEEDTLFCKADVREGQCIRKAGEDIQEGSIVLPKGTLITAAHLSLLASIGVAKVKVFRKLKIAVLATGDELVIPGNPLSPGEIYESNRTGLIAMLQKLPVEVVDFGIVKDNLEETRNAFQQASRECDWVISSGGVSVGDADFVKQVLGELGEINFWKVAIKPGKPYAFGKLGNAWFSGLPGNPVSCFITFMQLVSPTLQILSGDNYTPPQTYQATLTTDIRRRAGRTEFQRATMWNEYDGKLMVKPKGKQGSGIMNSFTDANCFLIIPAETSLLEAGELVSVLPIDNLL